MDRRIRVTEYLYIDLDARTWHCERCDQNIGSADEDYKRGLRLYNRNPQDIYPPRFDGEQHTYAPDPEWCRIVEYYCPGCATQVETEYLPPGHPLTRDIDIDVDAYVARVNHADQKQVR